MIQKEQLEQLKNMIRDAEVVSFDIFDTLIKRLVNRPEDIFALTGEIQHINGFEKIRTEGQMKVSMKAEREWGQPHADYDQIYDYISGEEQRPIDWNAVKKCELELESKAIIQNKEIYDVYSYAIQQGKRVIAVSDMYLKKEHILPILQKCGYMDFSEIYVSADLLRTKYRGDIFPYVQEKEGITGDKIIHIGDNYSADYENAIAAGWKAFHYGVIKYPESKRYMLATPVDFGVSEILMNEKKGFWYNLGVSVGGPLYMGIYQWLKEKLRTRNEKNIFFLARDGYNIWKVFENDIEQKSEYLYVSRRSMLFAGITELDDETMRLLPPFTLGQTIEEIIEYCGLPYVFSEKVEKVGFKSVYDVIHNLEDVEKMKRLYHICEKEFLEKCRKDREEVVAYFEKMNVFQDEILVFDCGWNGSSQLMLERVFKAAGKKTKVHFFYIGILDTEKSKIQLHNRSYETYLFDHSTNYGVQETIKQAIVVFELFFGAPHSSVLEYFDGKPILEKTDENYKIKSDICDGVRDFVHMAKNFVSYAGIIYTPEIALAPVIRLMEKPTEEEAVEIGNVENADGFANQKNIKKYIAKIDEKSYSDNPNIEIYWPVGLFKRNDISEKLKCKIAKDRGYQYDATDKSEEKREASSYNWLEKIYNRIHSEKNDYQIWIEENERDIENTTRLAYNPMFSVVIPVYNVTDEQLCACVDSIIDQTYENWELILVDDYSSWESVRNVLRRYEKHKKITVIYRTENGHISKATNDGINIAKGEFIVFSDCDDVLAVNALYEMAKKLNENKDYDFIYSDEDKLSEDGKHRHSPFFKPDWSPDTFMSLMYTNHLAIYRTNLVKKTGGLRTEFNGAQDYDFTLRFMELSDNKRVGHVPKVLYHWREREESVASTMKAKPYALEAMRKLKEEALCRRKLSGKVNFVSDMYQYRVVYDTPQYPLVSVIIPSKDNYSILEQCVKSIYKHTDYPNYEIILVDNGSAEGVRKKVEKLAEEHNITYVYEKMEFNFSRMCNIGVRHSNGDFVLLLNDDIEIFQNDWMGILVGQASLDYAGAVGAKLLYPNSNLIQHIGVTNLKIGPSHNEIRRPDSSVYYFGRNRMNYNYLAVTGACLMVNKDKYMKAGMMDEKLTVAYNDVDLCFALYELGYYNVVRNDVVCYHHESVSRGVDELSIEKQRRLLGERQHLYQKHPGLYQKDPFYNINLAVDKGDYSINIKENPYWNGCLLEKENSYSKYSGDVAHSVDSVVDAGNMVIVQGWIVASTKNDLLYERYIVLESETGEVCKMKLNRTLRPDVQDALHTDTSYVGFRLEIPYGVLSRSRTNYRVCILVQNSVTRKKRYVRTDLHILKKVEFYCRKVNIEVDLDLVEKKNALVIDEMVRNGDEISIRGWVQNLEDDMNLGKKYLVIKKGDEYSFYLLNDEFRLDLAAEFPDVSYAGYAGFYGVVFTTGDIRGILYVDEVSGTKKLLKHRN
jgi:predicted HAD superfamily hydrolase/GT2 family glycosyltransferase